MNLLSAINFVDLFYSAFTVGVTIVFIILARVFGKLPVSSVGPDLNLLTYGFLWDTATKAFRNTEYWPRFVPSDWPINQPTTLALVSFLNLILLGFNMKLAYRIEVLTQASPVPGYVTWAYKPFSLALGLTSLLAFLYISAAWG